MEKIYECPGCGKEINKDGFEPGCGVCEDCANQGLWMDPAGGLHYSNDEDYDPASMYE